MKHVRHRFQSRETLHTIHTLNWNWNWNWKYNTNQSIWMNTTVVQPKQREFMNVFKKKEVVKIKWLQMQNVRNYVISVKLVCGGIEWFFVSPLRGFKIQIRAVKLGWRMHLAAMIRLKIYYQQNEKPLLQKIVRKRNRIVDEVLGGV